jgi:hypothetical protein
VLFLSRIFKKLLIVLLKEKRRLREFERSAARRFGHKREEVTGRLQTIQ